jgi:UTP--glucose-1-phosphate uridylyltransferase
MEMMVEKPSKQDAPSLFATPGRYVLNSSIFQYLREIPRGRGGEFQLTDAINAMAKTHPYYSYCFEGERFDTGNPVGYVDATIDFALKDPRYRDDVLKIINNKLQKYNLNL